MIAIRDVTVVNPQGFHARPADSFVKLARTFQSQVEILKGNEVINGKSILELLTMGAINGTTLPLRASGPDAQAAVDALARKVSVVPFIAPIVNNSRMLLPLMTSFPL